MNTPTDGPYRETRLIVGSIVLLFCIFAALLWLLGLFRFDGSDASAKVISATFALAGAFGASLFSLIGVMLRHSIDVRSEKRLLLESDRNDLARRESENRLKLEASIRAVQLLSTTSGQAAPSAQITGALLTLASLSQYDLVLELVDDFAKQRQLDPGTICGLLDNIMIHGSAAQEAAVIGVLYRNESNFVNSAGLLEMPDCFFRANDELSAYARSWIPIFVARAIMKRPIGHWRQDKAFLYGLVGALGFQYQSELEPRIKSDVGAILAAVLRALPELREAHVPAGDIDFDQIRPALVGIAASLGVARATVKEIESWATAAPDDTAA